MASKFVTGSQCKLYAEIENTWTEIKHVGDVDIGGMETNSVDIKIRGIDWTAKMPTTHGTPTLTFEVLATNAETTAQLRDDFMNKTIRRYMEATGTPGETDTIATTFHAFVSKFDQSNKLDDISKYSVELTFALVADDSDNAIPPEIGTGEKITA